MGQRHSSNRRRDRDGDRRRRVPNTRKEEAIVRYIAERLVDDPEAVSLSRRVEGSTVVLELAVAPSDTGRVIGRNGRVAEAIRKVMGIVTHPRDRVILKIL